jgi:YHS domain-containing protein
VTRIILVAVLLILIARAFWRVIDGIIAAASGQPRAPRDTPATTLVRDPVCGTFVPPRDSLSLTVRGATHYFCSEQCRANFRKTA